MLPEKLYTIESEDWKRVEEQFEVFYAPVFVFVTENKGSLDEARKIYIDAFIYYARSLELHGAALIDKGQEMVYSFARKLWIKKLHGRRADTSFIRHRREFLEVDDAFDDIDLIDRRTDMVSKELAAIGEPGRTLTLEYVGHGKDVEDVMRRLGSGNRERTFAKVVTCLRRLIEATEKRKINLDDERFVEFLNHIVCPEEITAPEYTALSDEERVDLALISRTVAIIRGYVKRKERMARLLEISKYQMPDKCAALNAVTQTHKTKKKMKPLHMVLTVASIAMFISALTSFGVLHMDGAGDGELLEASLVDIPAADSLPEMETPIATRYLTAFAVAAPGYYLTSSDVGGPGSSCLMRGGDDYNIHGKVIHRDTVLGLAVVFDPMDQMNGLPYMPAAEASPMGETVFTVGFPDGGFQYSQGVISSTDEQFSKADISGSAPGAPVFAPQGQWIGIIVNSQENKGKSKILHVGEIRDFLEKAIDGGDYPKAIMPRRNRLYYDNRPAQVDKIRPQVRMIEIKG